MVTFRTCSPEARLEQFQGAALVTCRRSLMDGKLQQGELTFLSCLFAGLLWKRALHSSLLTSVSQGKGAVMLIKSDFVVAKFAFYLGCL